jgi:hypothetical protein
MRGEGVSHVAASLRLHKSLLSVNLARCVNTPEAARFCDSVACCSGLAELEDARF